MMFSYLYSKYFGRPERKKDLSKCCNAEYTLIGKNYYLPDVTFGSLALACSVCHKEKEYLHEKDTL